MSYCVNCGVELHETCSVCPLCHTEVHNPRHPADENAPKPFPVRQGAVAPVQKADVLILISVIISGFVYIPKIQASFGGKKKTAETTQEAPKAAAPAAPVVESEEELSDDLELVAVIAAAIAASEGAASTDGFVVRSIRRANTNKWQRA